MTFDGKKKKGFSLFSQKMINTQMFSLHEVWKGQPWTFCYINLPIPHLYAFFIILLNTVLQNTLITSELFVQFCVRNVLSIDFPVCTQPSNSGENLKDFSKAL